MEDFFIILGIFLLAGLMLYPLWNDLTPDHFADFSIIQIILTIPIFLGILLAKLLVKTGPFFTSKPFKKAKFKVGEEVMYNGRKSKIIRNEKDCTGNCVAIEIWRSYGRYITEVPVGEVKRLTKLEQALK